MCVVFLFLFAVLTRIVDVLTSQCWQYVVLKFMLSNICGLKWSYIKLPLIIRRKQFHVTRKTIDSLLNYPNIICIIYFTIYIISKELYSISALIKGESDEQKLPRIQVSRKKPWQEPRLWLVLEITSYFHIRYLWNQYT